MVESMVSKFKAEKSKFIVKILSFYGVLRLIHDFHKLLTFHKRPAGIHNQIALEKTILYAVCDEVIAQTAQCCSFCCAVPLRQQLLYLDPILFFDNRCVVIFLEIHIQICIFDGFMGAKILGIGFLHQTWFKVR